MYILNISKLSRNCNLFCDFNIIKNSEATSYNENLNKGKESSPKLSTIQKPHSTSFSLMMLKTEITVWFYWDINVYLGLLNNSFSNSQSFFPFLTNMAERTSPRPPNKAKVADSSPPVAGS